MLIDWFTVGAQALNFIILVWLLKRFLYRPILDAVDAREGKIAGELAQADARRAEATREHEEFRLKIEAFDRQRAALLARATEEASAEGRRLREAAKEAADAEAAKRREGLRAEAKELRETVARRTRTEVFAIARKALADLAGTTLEAQMIEVFDRQLRSMDATTRQEFGAALKAAGSPAALRTAFEPTPAQRAALRASLNDAFAGEVLVGFETAPDLIAGVELTTDGHKLAWSLSEYLTSLEKGLTVLPEVDSP